MQRFVFAAMLALLPVCSARAQPLADYHQHLFSPETIKLSGAAAVDAAALVALLDEAGIRRALVLSVAYQFGNPNKPPVANEYAHVKEENDWTSRQAARFPERLRAFCSVNPLRPYALEEIARCARDPQLRRGLKMHFGNSDVDLLNADHLAQLRRVFQAAGQRGMAIVVHMRSTVSRRAPYGAAQARSFIDNLLPAAGGVPVQIAHLTGAGGYDDPLVDEALGVFVDAIARHDPRLARVYFDVSGVAGLGNWEKKKDAIANRIRQLGVSRVLYGSDGAGGRNPTPLQAWKSFRSLPLSEDEFHAIEQNVAPYLR